MRAGRLISILLLLQSRGRMTAPQLAAELEVSVRTVYRDIQALHTAGIPLYSDAGPAGGYQLVGGYRTRLTGLTADEAQTLFLAGVPQAAAELGLGSVLAGAQLKLQAALPDGLREHAARIQERFHLDAPGWYYDGDSPDHLAAVAGTVWHQQRAEIHYRRWAAPTDVTRIVDPHGIVLKAGNWYLVARTGGGFRTYRISQILALRVTGERFSRDPGFDLPSYWASQVAEFRAGLRRDTATIRLSPAGRTRLRELMGSAVIEAVDATATDPDDGGWVTAIVPIESLEHAKSEFLRLGAEAEILTPDALRTQMAAIARSLAGIYRTA